MKKTSFEKKRIISVLFGAIYIYSLGNIDCCWVETDSSVKTCLVVN